MQLHYDLTCLDTGRTMSDLEAPLVNPAATQPALLRTRYHSTRFAPGPREDGIYRFAEWLPIRRRLHGSSAPVTYKSEGLAGELGLENLYITFSGYWPEREALMLTGTFKECEAFSVCARTPENEERVLVVASAGNTARAFARVCSENAIPLVVVVPERNLPAIWSIGALSDCVRVIAAGGDSDYADAIQLAAIISDLPGFTAEGGAKNVARRDGMGTTVLSAADTIGRIPDRYFQAVGSGTGAIAAWEAAMRLRESGQFDTGTMTLHVSQNAPFAPIHQSWLRKERRFVDIDDKEARLQIAQIGAKVLANRKPPYSLVGGLYDALADSNGDTASITNNEAQEAGTLFERLEGIELAPAARVATAHLFGRVRGGEIGKNETIMLNITGGGISRVQDELDVRPIVPTRVIDRSAFNAGSVESVMSELF